MQNILKTKGYKVTPARLAILDVLFRSKAPITADIIYRELLRGNKCVDVNEATVYRTLSLFEDGGIVRRVNLRKESVFFELVEGRHHHHHIVCVGCDAVEDFESKSIEKVLSAVALKSSNFINIKEHSLELFGLCKGCAK